MLVRNTDARPAAYEDMKDVYRPVARRLHHRGQVRHPQLAGRRPGAAPARRSAGSRPGRSPDVCSTASPASRWWRGSTRCTTSTPSVDRRHRDRSPRWRPDPRALSRCRRPRRSWRRPSRRPVATATRSGGVVQCVARNVPPGLGEPVFDKLDAELAKAMLSLPAAKGFEIGSGFAGTRLTRQGAQRRVRPRPRRAAAHRDQPLGRHPGRHQQRRARSSSRVAFKPTATICLRAAAPSTATATPVTLAAQGRHDPCVLPRAVPMVEAMALLVTRRPLAPPAGHRRALTDRATAGGHPGPAGHSSPPSAGGSGWWRRKRSNSAARSSPDGRSLAVARSDSSSRRRT